MTDRPGVDTGGFGGGGTRWSTGRILATIAALGCLAVIVLMATCVGGGALWWKRSTSSAGAEVRPFLEKIGRGEYDDAYMEVASSWKERTTVEEFRESFSVLTERLGSVQELNVRGMNIRRGEESFREVQYVGTFERGRAFIRVRLEPDTDGVERISGVQFDFRVEDGEDDDSDIREIEGVTVLEGNADEADSP